MIATTRRADLSIVEFCPPGETPVAIGVILLDPESGEHRVRFRRDWEEIAGEEAEVLSLLASDFGDQLHERGSAYLDECEQSLSNALRVSDRESVVCEDLDRAVERLYSRHVRPRVLRFQTHLPKFSAKAAATRFLYDMEVEPEGWIETPEVGHPTERMFVVPIVGRSMEPRIPDGSLAVFRSEVGGSREGKILLIELLRASQSGGEHTVKRYRSRKRTSQSEEDVWEHQAIRLEPLNPEFPPLDLQPDDFRVIGEFVMVLPEAALERAIEN